MGDEEGDVQQMTTGRIRTRVAAFWTEPIWVPPLPPRPPTSEEPFTIR